jgi:membrane-bound serine protease (ClpP class)
VPRTGRRVGSTVPAVVAALGVALVCLIGLAPPASGQAAEAPRVLHTTVKDAITPVIADHLHDAVERAEGGGYDLLVVELDTPGGLDSSMRDIIQDVLDAELPVAVYVSPRGARAASAGALIALSAHVAAMAPGTAIGASTPVDLEGGEVNDKVVNDAAAYAEALAELRGRDVAVAAEMVRDGRSLPVSEAVDAEVVDLAAGSVTDLLDDIDGLVVDVGPESRPTTLRTAGAAIDDYEMGLLRRIQQVLADPNLVFLFLSLGTLGIIYELATPGVGAGGVVGVTFILLALFALSVLPVSAVGVLLLLLAGAMFVAELFAPGLGIAAAGGTGALVLSGIFLFREAPGLEVSMAVVAPVAVVVGGAVVVAGRLVVRSRRALSTLTGPGLLVGQVATVRRAGPASGQAFLEGAWWNVRSTCPPVDDGSLVRVVGMDGLDLLVEPVDAQPVDAQPDDPRADNRSSDNHRPDNRGLQDHE